MSLSLIEPLRHSSAFAGLNLGEEDENQKKKEKDFHKVYRLDQSGTRPFKISTLCAYLHGIFDSLIYPRSSPWPASRYDPDAPHTALRNSPSDLPDRHPDLS
jgi:hypothetical protein